MAFNQLKKQGTRDPLPSVAVKVSAFIKEGDRDMVQGVRMDTQEEVKVYLRDDKNTKRPTIADFANQNHPQLSTKPGGVMLFDGCYKDADGNLSAKWPSCMNRTGEPANGIVLAGVMARLAVPKGNGNPYVTIANQSGASVVHSREEFAEAATKALAKKVNAGFAPGNPGFILRGVDADGDVFTVVRNNDPNTSPEEHVKKIMSEMDDAVFGYMGEQGVWEVIPTANIGSGKFARENERHMDPSDYLVGKGPNGRDVYGFAPSNLVIGPIHKDGKVDGFFAKHASTVTFKPDVVPPGYVPTQNVSPKFDKEAYFSPSADHEAEAEPEGTPAAPEPPEAQQAADAAQQPAPQPDPAPEPEPEEPAFG